VHDVVAPPKRQDQQKSGHSQEGKTPEHIDKSKQGRLLNYASTK